MTTPGIIIAGTHSGCGKSTVVCGLINVFIQHGYVVAPFKVGPDYLDPILHKAISGRPSWNLDGWLFDDATLTEAWSRGSLKADLALVEGAMGLFDGADSIRFRGSGADLAIRLKLPIVLVIDSTGIGSTVAATVLGCTKLMPNLNIVGVIFNRVASERHYNLLQTAVITHTNVKPLGWIQRSKTWQLPERHLGIFNPEELPGLKTNIDSLSLQITSTIDLKMLASMARSPIAVNIPITKSLSSSLPVAIAKDAAFSFIYEDTLDRLERLGVRWVPFSPLKDRLPLDVAGVYLPGGYPELHAEELSSNGSFFADLRYAHSIGMPIFAECGGYMSMAEAMIGINGCTYPMANIIPGRSRMTNRLQLFGYKRLIAAQNTLLCPNEAIGQAHEFHYSIWEGIPNSPAWLSKGTDGNEAWQGHVDGNLLASYVHLHFGAIPNWANAWVTKMQRWFTSKR